MKILAAILLFVTSSLVSTLKSLLGTLLIGASVFGSLYAAYRWITPFRGWTQRNTKSWAQKAMTWSFGTLEVEPSAPEAQPGEAA